MNSMGEFERDMLKIRKDFAQEIPLIMDAVGAELLAETRKEIVRQQLVDTRDMLNSFSLGNSFNVFEKRNNGYLVEAGTVNRICEIRQRGPLDGGTQVIRRTDALFRHGGLHFRAIHGGRYYQKTRCTHQASARRVTWRFRNKTRSSPSAARNQASRSFTQIKYRRRSRSVAFSYPLLYRRRCHTQTGFPDGLVMATVTFFAPKRSTALADAEKVLLALERRGNKVPLYTQNNTIAGQFLLMDAKIRAIENPVDTVGAVTLTVAWHEEVEHIITRGPLVNRVATYLN